jgi:hypothetical protein
MKTYMIRVGNLYVYSAIFNTEMPNYNQVYLTPKEKAKIYKSEEIHQVSEELRLALGKKDVKVVEITINEVEL